MPQLNHANPLALIPTVAIAAMLAACSGSPVQASYAGEEWEDSFMQQEFTRFYRVHVPDRPEVGPAAPLVLAFHGVGQDGEQFRARAGLDAVADAEGFIVVYLEAAMGAWDIFGDLGFLGLDDIAYVREVIDRVSRHNVIDLDKVIAVGLSNGGVFSQQLACTLSDRLAGFVAVGALMPRALWGGCTPARPISAAYVIGDADAFFPAAGNQVTLSIDEVMAFWAARSGCSGGRTRSTWPDADGAITTAYWSRYRPCDHGTHVWLDSIAGGGHAWPGAAVPAPAQFGPTSRDVSANTEIARLLRALPRR